MFPLVPLTHHHGGILEKIHASCFPDAWNKDAFNRFLGEKGTCGWMATSLREEPVGFILARALGNEAEILTFAVRPSFQRLGIGRCLLRALMDLLHSVGCEKIFLEVAVDNEAAIALYGSIGFREVGTRPNYYQRAPQTFIPASVMAWVKSGPT